MQKKILYCDSNIDGTIGGSYFSLFYLAEGIDKSRYIPVVIFYTNNALVPMYRNAGIETHVFERPHPYQLPALVKKYVSPIPVIGLLAISVQKVINFIRFLPGTALTYAKYLKQNNVDLVHLNNSILRSHDWILATLLSGKRCIVHERGINRRYPYLAKLLSRHIDSIICISSAVKQSLLNGGINKTRLEMIYNGLDPSSVRVDISAVELKKKYNIGSNTLVLGVIGNIKPWKGQKTIIQAMIEVSKVYKDVKCLLVGDTAKADMHYHEEIRTLVNEYNLGNNIVFTGYQANVANYLNIMDIAVHTSVQPEPFGRVIIEAMAMKKPIIGADAGAVSEIIFDGKTGYLYPPADAGKLAEIIIRLLGSEKQRLEMGKQGYQRLMENFHIKKYITKIENLYDDIL